MTSIAKDHPMEVDHITLAIVKGHLMAVVKLEEGPCVAMRGDHPMAAMARENLEEGMA